MSITPPSKGTHFSDGVRVGPIFNSQYAPSSGLNPPELVASPADSEAPGIYLTPESLLDIVPAAVAAAAIAAPQTAAGAGYLTLRNVSDINVTWMPSFLNNSGPTGAGVLKLDVARSLIISGATNVVAANYTVFGLDKYLMPMVETITGPVGANRTEGVKAFKYVLAVYVSTGTVANVSVGVGNTFGLPYFVEDENYIFQQKFGGVLDAGTILGGDLRTATATTGDVRGTYTPASDADSDTRLTITFYNASGDTRNSYASNSSVYLKTDALSITNTTNIITVTAPGHRFTNGENVTISGATAIGNVTAPQINITAPVTIVNSNSFTYVFSGTAATSTADGGGAAIQMSPGKGNLYQFPTGRFGVTQYTQAFF
jgi:hypothetical protein